MSDKFKNLIVRTLSGIVLTVVVVGAVSWSRWSFGALLLAILLGGMWEFYRMVQREEVIPLRWIGMAAGAVLFATAFLLPVWPTNRLLLPMLCFVLLIPAMFVCELFLQRKHPAADIGVTLVGVCYVALPLAMMGYLPLLLNGGAFWSPQIILSYIFIIWANDVFAYLVGTSMGRHPLCERISPKKSWEGFFGGLAGAVGMGCVAAWWLDANYLLWGGLALVVAVSGVLGDLVESMFKRSAGVKDSGNILPGHGGWLDRFDALIFSLPFAIVYLILLSIS